MTLNLHELLSEEDQSVAARYVGSLYREPDLIIAPDGSAYLYRWHVTPRNRDANVYFHIQVASDPERPLHDHPWANTSVILSGGYMERVQFTPPTGPVHEIPRLKGDTIFRDADLAHRLIMLPDVPYTMTLFFTGPKVRDWGFWCGDTWHSNETVLESLEDGRSIWKGPSQ